MKTLFFTICLFVFAGPLFAQNQKTVIYCTVGVTGIVRYGDLAKFLPDSLKTSILVDPRKDLNLRKLDHVLLYMFNNGWKLASIESNVTGGGMVTSDIYYFLTKEIYLDNAAHALFMQNLLNSEKR
jgi:hypothetical protein